MSREVVNYIQHKVEEMHLAEPSLFLYLSLASLHPTQQRVTAIPATYLMDVHPGAGSLGPLVFYASFMLSDHHPVRLHRDLTEKDTRSLLIVIQQNMAIV